MKKVLILIAFMGAAGMISAQKTAQPVFTQDEVVWYGLDFSQARFIGQFDQAAGAGEASAWELKHKYIPAWNALILNEPNKYDLQKTFQKSKVLYELKPVEKSNAELDEGEMQTYQAYRFENPEETVSEIISAYTAGDQSEGVGLVFVVEYFHKDEKEASIYVSFFDIATRKLIFTERLTSSPRGIGLRNYWAGAIHRMLRDIERGAFKSWRKKYMN